MPSERQTLQLYIIHGTVLDLLLLIVTCIELNRAHRCAACPALHLLYCLGSRTRKTRLGSLIQDSAHLGTDRGPVD